MTTLTPAPHQPDRSGRPDRHAAEPGRDGFVRLLHAEWTKFRTVRGWVIGMLAAAVVFVLVGLLGSAGSSFSCSGPNGEACPASTQPTGPDGEPVTDRFSFVHQPLSGDGSFTVRLASLTGLYTPESALRPGPPTTAGMTSGTQPWTKAGIVVKENTTEGSAYAAIMATGGHGVRMQYNFTHDTAGSSATVTEQSPRWLRLTRTGDLVTGYESADGEQWTEVSTATLAGLPSTVQVGMFVASPEYTVTTETFGGVSSTGGPTQATAVFDEVSLDSAAAGNEAGDEWTGTDVGGSAMPGSGFRATADGFSVTGSGDVAPSLPGRGPTKTIEAGLVGAFAGLIGMIVVATTFMTAEYRRGLIRTTFTASPHRARALAAKAVVVGTVTFVVGLVASAVAVPLVAGLERDKGLYVFPATAWTELRVVVGTAALLAVAAVMAVGVGAVLRRGAGAATAVIVLIVVPYVLAVSSVLPSGAGQWLLRITPAAGFAVQQSVPEYSQVAGEYTPALGYFPLPPWGGFAVLFGYAAVALGTAAVLVRRRDA